MNERAHIPLRFGVEPPEPLPLKALVLGRPPEAVAALLPRLFNLCRHAQGAAARMALGLGAPDCAALAREIAQEHRLHLTLFLPRALGLAPLAPPGGCTAEALFAGELPATPERFEAFLAQGAGIAPLFSALIARFAPGEAATPTLPAVTPATALSPTAQENSAAARHAGHALMRHIEASHGRGPLWRVLGRALDLQAAARGILPAPRLIAPGTAMVPSARGLYTLRLEVAAGAVTALARTTPTDHLLAPGGLLDHSLASLGGADRAQAELLLAVLDPCVPLVLREVSHA